MEVSVSGRHTAVPETLRQQATEKIGRLDRYLGMERAEVHFWQEHNKKKGDRILAKRPASVHCCPRMNPNS